MITDQNYSDGNMTTASDFTTPYTNTDITYTQWPYCQYCTHRGLGDYSIEDLALELSKRIMAKDSEGAALEKLIKDIKSKRVTIKT